MIQYKKNTTGLKHKSKNHPYINNKVSKEAVKDRESKPTPTDPIKTETPLLGFFTKFRNEFKDFNPPKNFTRRMKYELQLRIVPTVLSYISTCLLHPTHTTIASSFINLLLSKN
jgi:hypothetical protein